MKIENKSYTLTSISHSIERKTTVKLGKNYYQLQNGKNPQHINEDILSVSSPYFSIFVDYGKPFSLKKYKINKT